MKHIYRLRLLAAACFMSLGVAAVAQHSVARDWNEALLGAIRRDLARPTVHARNLFHTSIAMYDAWAAYDTAAQTFLLGKTVGGFTSVFAGVPAPADVEAARREAISYACYRVLRHRFLQSPGAAASINSFNALMAQLGYNINVTATNYQSGSPAALGNYIASQIIQFGLQDGANEQNGYANQVYAPVNPALVMDLPGNPDLLDLNRWQPLTLDVFIDQSGNVIPFNTPPFLTPEWGRVAPFAMGPEDQTLYERNGNTYTVYNDPGAPPAMDTLDGGGSSAEYAWNFALVSAWSAHLTPDDGVMWNISPGAYGNSQSLPTTFEEYEAFYDLMEGGNQDMGHPINPVTGQPYPDQWVPRGDYTRVLAEFWADGPESETPPGHWFTILNYVNDHPSLVKRFRGTGEVLDDLEWDVKAYLLMGGAMHDAAITAWSIKGWYDYVRPVSAIRGMAEYGQSSDPGLPSFHPAGLPLIPGRIELVMPGDPLAGSDGANVGKIKLYAWRGPNVVINPAIDVAGVGWILAEEWWPYQRPTFVTPPFAGYISGHSTYSRTAAELLTRLTDDPFFPGGVGEFPVEANTFLKFERGPSMPFTLQWATYEDAADQSSLSRIWGGIHPPVDDIPGRKLGGRIADKAFNLGESLFYRDADGDGFFSYEDCDDADPDVYPGAEEICDGKDNDCDDSIDEGALLTFYFDADADGYGDPTEPALGCEAPAGYVANNEDCNDASALQRPGQLWYPDLDGDGYGRRGASPLVQCLRPAGHKAAEELVAIDADCDDAVAAVNPGATETCNGLDDNCNDATDEGVLTVFYRDADTDGYGDPSISILSCTIPAGYVFNADDCNDADHLEKPGQRWYPDIDNDGYGAQGVEQRIQCLRPPGYKELSELLGYENDCNDNDAAINPAAVEICNGIDDNCNGAEDEGLPLYRYFGDADGDGFGRAEQWIEVCAETAPSGFVANELDCNDDPATGGGSVYPGAPEVADNGIDEDCSGVDLYLARKAFPNPVTDWLTVRLVHEGTAEVYLYQMNGQLARRDRILFTTNEAAIDFRALPPGVYWLRITDASGAVLGEEKILKRG